MSRKARADRVTKAVLAMALVAGVAVVGVPPAPAGAASTSWSPPANIEPGIDGYTAVSCTSTFGPCVAVDGQGNVIEDPGNPQSDGVPVSVNVDPGGDLTAISCPHRVDSSNDFCIAVDSAGNAFTYFGPVNVNGTLAAAWSGPTAVDPGGSLSSVACTTQNVTSPTVAETTCVVVDTVGNAFAFSGGTWSSANAIDPGAALTSASCADDAVSCVAVANDGSAFTYDGATWTPSVIDAGNSLASVSCPSASLCVAVDTAGNAITFNGGTWGSPVAIDPGGGLTSVSCDADQYCAAVDGTGHAVMYNATATASYPAGWIGPMDVDRGGSLVSVSCDDTFSCDAVDARGDSFGFAGPNGFAGSPGWSGGVSDTALYLSQVSCPSASFCAAIDDQGRAFTYDGTDWSAPTAVDPGGDYSSGSGNYLKVSCTSATFCEAVNNTGASFTYDGTSWSAPSSLDPGDTPTSVSCVSASFCAAVDAEGNAFIDDGTNVTESSVGVALKSVTCTSSTFCMATAGDHQTTTYNGTGWTLANGPASVDFLGHAYAPDSMSCATSSFCAAVNIFGQAFTYNGSSWSASLTNPGQLTMNAVSCSSSTFCAALGGNGSVAGVITFDGTSWSAPTDVDPGPPTMDGATPILGPDALVSVSCPSTNFCTVADRDGSAFTSKGTPTLVITPSSLTSGIGAVTYTVSVGGPGSVPTGSVHFSDGKGGSCDISSLTAGAGSCAMTESAASGPYAITASYSGDGNFAGASTSITVAGGVSASGAATAASNSVSATATGGTNGADVVTVANYQSNPVGAPTFQASGKYFDALLSAGNTFTRDVITDCDLNGGEGLKWWNPSANAGAGAWAAVVGHPGPTFTSPCVSVTVDGTTSPNLSQLNGTVFAVSDTAPGVPTSVSAVPGSTSATVRWTAPAFNGGSAITGYVVTPFLGATAQATRTFNTTATSHPIPGLTNAKSYTFKVAAKNAIGTGANSVASVAIIVGTPVAPTAVKAPSGSATATTGSMTVSYVAGVNNGAAITQYTATCVSSNGGVAKTGVHVGATAVPIVVSGVTTKKTYTCTVKATNSRGLGPASAASTAVIIGAPAAPTAAHAVKAAAGQLKVTFTPGPNNGATVTSYTATCTSSNLGVTKAKAGTASPVTVVGLTTTKTYTCTVKATNSRGTSAASAASAAVKA